MFHPNTNAVTDSQPERPPLCRRCAGSSRLQFDPATCEEICPTCGAVADAGPAVAELIDGSPVIPCPLSGVVGTRAGRVPEVQHPWLQATIYNRTTDMGLRRATTFIRDLCRRLRLSYTVEMCADSIYARAHRKGIVASRSTEAMAGASLYLACRQMSVPRTLREIEAAVDNARPGKRSLKIGMRHAYRLVVKELEIKTPIINGRALAGRIAQSLDMDVATARGFYKLLDIAYTTGMHECKDPLSFIAGAAMVACEGTGRHVTAAEVASATDRTESTVRNRAIEIRRTLASRPT